MTAKQTSLFGLFLFTLASLLVLAISIFGNPHAASAAAPAGYNAQVATSSTLTVGPGNNTPTGLGTSTPSVEQRYTCAARIITTVGQPIMISFASLSSTTLSQTSGHLQAASTTQVYDGGLYGCGYMTIRGLNASTTITLTETK